MIEPNNDGWTVEHLAWNVPEHQQQRRRLTKPTGWRFLQGNGHVQGRLIGGCVESLQRLRDTRYVARELRTYAAMGILRKLSIVKIVVEEEGLTNLPIVTQMDFGHTDPMSVLPYGVFVILESAVVD